MLNKEIITNVIGNIEAIVILVLINIIFLHNLLSKLNLNLLSIIRLSNCPPKRPQVFRKTHF